ncbi:MAG: hypothetical protein IE881_08505 [Epsilonproteobacteria bacterium]|nr:hypothetical protein [Campylobacterota bacterium]
MIEQRNLSLYVYDEFQVSGILDTKELFKNAFIISKIRMAKELFEDDIK